MGINMQNNFLSSIKNRFNYLLKRHQIINNAAYLVAFVALFLFILQSISNVNKIPLMFDETLYLFKGYQFIKGNYTPYQAYGFYMNKMPLIYYLYGLIQNWFGVGFLIGRYFSILSAVIMILGYWTLANRLVGKWAGAIMVVSFSLNPALVGIYSQATSQAIAACVLVWTLAITFKKKPSVLRIVVGSAIAGILTLMRLNLFPVIGLIVLFNFWENGKKSGFISLTTILMILFIGHILFWPGIFKIWLIPIPKFIKNILPFIVKPSGEPVLNQHMSMISRVHSFWEMIRIDYISIIGFILALLFWKSPKKKNLDFHKKITISLSILFAILLFIHAWETLAKNRCVYCLVPYYSFFYGIGILIFLLSFHDWNKHLSTFNEILFVLIGLFTLTGIGFSTHLDIGENLLSLSVPRIRNLHILPGSTTLEALLTNMFHVSHKILKIWVPTSFGFLIALGILLLVIIFRYISLKRVRKYSIGVNFLLIIYMLGIILTPTPILAGSRYANSLNCDVLGNLKAVGLDLDKKIPENALIYWGSQGKSFPLVYIKNVRVFPQQLDAGYSMRFGGNTEELERLGYWNEESAIHWQKESDFIIIEYKDFNGDIVERIDPNNYNELEKTPPLDCQDPYSSYRIFIKKR